MDPSRDQLDPYPTLPLALIPMATAITLDGVTTRAQAALYTLAKSDLDLYKLEYTIYQHEYNSTQAKLAKLEQITRYILTIVN